MRILYAAGNGDVANTFRHWSQGQDDPSQVAVTYSSLFFDFCRDANHTAYVIATCPKPADITQGSFRIRHRAMPFARRGGIFFHFSQIYNGLRLTASALRFRADVAVIGNGSAYWFAFALLPLFGVKVIPSLHCVLWGKSRPRKPAQRLISRLEALFFRHTASAILCLSDDISDQLQELTAGRHAPLVPFQPLYRPEAFAGIAPPSENRNPFRVLYAGRVEANKGVFDLLTIARRFRDAGRYEIEFDLCGSGSALEALRAEVQKANLSDKFRLHGHCSREVMRQMYQQSHVVIAPTTSDFIEGFNKVVAEGALAGRPVITSSVCPAIRVLRDAVVEVPPDDVTGYANAILQLCDDRALYASKQQGCIAARERFYNPANCWGQSLKKAIETSMNQPS